MSRVRWKVRNVETPVYRLLNDWEVEVVERLFSRLYKEKVIMGRDDTMQWMEEKSDAFLVKSMYKALDVRPPISFPMKMFWDNCV